MMGIALGGLGVLSVRLPHNFAHLVDLPTILLAALLVAVLGLVAYFTNPSEASFRAFLTELAFRHHLSRLRSPDPDDDDDEQHLARPIDYKGPRKKAPPAHDSPVLFHFANTAAVSLRTPGYRFRSFAVLTFAVVAPTDVALAGAQPPRGTAAHKGAWFVGAFGHWWLGLEIRMLPRTVRLAAHDEHAVAVDAPPPRPVEEHPKPPRHARPAPRTKAALRERLSLHTNTHAHANAHAHANHPPRPTTPPPLPKSASLPLHGPPPAPPLLPPSPVLADLIAQFDAARAENAELHAQVAAYRTPPPSHAALHAAVAEARETKKRDDAGRAALKARTKSLDDARRTADGRKREAEKRLKAAAARRDGTTATIERHECDITGLRARMADDTARVDASSEESKVESARVAEELTEKRTEVAEAEEAVVQLTQRARDVEGEVAAEMARLEALKARVAWPPPLVSPPQQFSPFLPSSLVQSIGATSPIESPRFGMPGNGHATPATNGNAQVNGHAHGNGHALGNGIVLGNGHANGHAPASPGDLAEDRRRYYAPRERGLNPAAKVFTLPRARRRLSSDSGDSSPFFNDTPSPFFNEAPSPPFFNDSLASPFGYDTAPTSSPPAAPAFFAALHSAFAPSPAEREALQRALEEGGTGSAIGSAHSSPLVPPAPASGYTRTLPRVTLFNPWPASEGV